MKILLVYPQYPDTFWSFKHALKFTTRKALNTPLGLLTVAALLPSQWEKKVIDMNVTKLSDKDIKWADYVFISAMIVQRKSVREVVNRCRKLEVKVIAGGPLFTVAYQLFGFDDIDHIILNEAESTLPLFLADLKEGHPDHIYQTEEKADITQSPTPLFSLVDLKKYASVTIQYSRGCPFDCEFCDIITIDGRRPRTKSSQQVVSELEAIHRLGYRGSVFIVDDNFIGNKKKLKTEVLPAINQWMSAKEHPFTFFTEASINLADDTELMQLMADAGFNSVFVGIESPNEESLSECNKYTNQNRDLLTSVKRLQNYGFQVMGGFIVGFDSDPVSIFKSQINFIQNSGIVSALVNLLNASMKTRLWHLLEKEGRIMLDVCTRSTTDNTDCLINFIPKMKFDVLINGYKQILHTIYAPKAYYERIQTFLKEYKPNRKAARTMKLETYYITGMIKSTFVLGLRDKARFYYWKLFFGTLWKHPRLLGLTISLAAQGFHFRKVYESIKEIKVDDALLTRQQKVLGNELI